MKTMSLAIAGLILYSLGQQAAAAPEGRSFFAFDPWVLAFSLVTVVATVYMGFRSAGQSKSASDMMVAGRSVSVGMNASAISGEYLSAASFMGIASLVMLNGYDGLWYPVCFACGYLFLLLFIAGPLRRFGAYTIPDFAEGRFDSPTFRKIAVVFVLFIGFYYTMPQMKGAGIVFMHIFPGMGDWGYPIGVIIVGGVITLNVALGGMKGITLVQAFQYWLKMFAISVPAFVLMAWFGSYNGNLAINQTAPEVRAGVVAATVIARPEKAPADATWISPFGPMTTKAAKAANLPPEDQKFYGLIYTYSFIFALVCGTAGLPHILVRFYTNPDGVSAKKTTMWVMILIGIFYIFTPVYGVMGRNILPELYGLKSYAGTEGVVLSLPAQVPWVGPILSGITSAGAFAAFMSTFSGLLVSMTGAMAHDVYGKILRPSATAEQKMVAFKISAVAIGIISVGLGMLVKELNIAFMVGQAFAVAACSYFPLLFLSVWWRNITMPGAATGMLAGGLLCLITMTAKNLPDLKILPAAATADLTAFWNANPLLAILCEQPAIWAMPLSMILMIVVSKLTASQIPANIQHKMLVLHAPEKLGFRNEEYDEPSPQAH
ncbi:cation acetate symporter [Verrucomicrobia bacterium LW23]|nr:cation acetate symporter [Verrucomicrobia bacterium LW23]